MSMIIAIDPDAQKSGIAIFEGGKLCKLDMLSFADLTAVMQEVLDDDLDCTFVLEDVEAIKTTFRRGKTNQAAMMKIAQNVGQVKQTARLIAEMADHYGVNLVMIKPLGGVAKQAKTDAKLFNRLTGWTGRSNTDNRDAAMLGLHYLSRKK